MTFIIGFAMLGAGVLLLFIAQPREGKQAAFMKPGFIEFSVMMLVIVLVLGGLGMLIGSIANLIAG